MQRLACFLVLLVGATPNFASAQEFDEKFDHWPVDHRIRGRVIIGTKLADPNLLKQALPREQFRDGLLIVNQHVTADTIAGYQELYEGTKPADKSAEGQQASDEKTTAAEDKPDSSKKENAPKLKVIRTDSPDEIRQSLSDASSATLVIYNSTQRQQEAARSLPTLRDAFATVINRGATFVHIGPACTLSGRFAAVPNGKQQQEQQQKRPEIITGINLIPDTILQTDYMAVRHQPGLLSLLATNPRCVGIGLSPETLLVLSERVLRVVGPGLASFTLMANERQPIRSQVISQPRSRRESPSKWLVDLTEWRRDAIDRTLPVFPPAEPPTPHVENGTLVIVGGGGMPSGLMDRIVELAGGKDDARMVYIPCSSEWDVSDRQRTVAMWERMGVKHATFIHTKDRNKANSDEEFLAPLKDATGLWFGGGRQWNFADSYYGTKAHKLMKDVLKRGGVIGGSSAGASIQARYLARATPIENFRIMAPGYERGGLGFIGGVAIDQHFSQRRRQKDMTQLVNRYPQMLGIGIDEATAIIVQKSEAEVVGRGRVHFYNRELPVLPDQPDYIALPKGSKYNLADREVLVDASKKESNEE